MVRCLNRAIEITKDFDFGELNDQKQVILDRFNEIKKKYIVNITSKSKPKKIIKSLDEVTEAEDLKAYKVPELKAFLKEAELNPNGKKAILMERYFKFLKNPDSLNELDKKKKGKRGRPKKKEVEMEEAETEDELELETDKTEEEEEDDETSNLENIYTSSLEGLVEIVGEDTGTHKLYLSKKNETVYKQNEDSPDELFLIGLYIENDDGKYVNFDLSHLEDSENEGEESEEGE